ncbi:MAG: hypothetical protein JWN34_5418 [Bryobacterales bacterium]|nr:hypothetical protein [Bryobacterales bacterium]
MTRGTDAISRRGFAAGWLPLLFHRRERELCGVRFRVVERGFAAARRYLVIHGDEDTARDVLTKHMGAVTGRALIVTGKTRNVQVRGLSIDPDRMYSRAGAEASLAKLNPAADRASVEAVSQWLDRRREKLLQMLTPGAGSRLFALHNNRDYSVNDELGASDQVALNQPGMPRHFFLCTNPADFAILKQSPYNAVLQTQAEPDDGSMSRLAARRGFRYINLECAIGDFAGQMERVEWLESHLP